MSEEPKKESVEEFLIREAKEASYLESLRKVIEEKRLLFEKAQILRKEAQQKALEEYQEANKHAWKNYIR